jgi:hypothetical protein
MLASDLTHRLAELVYDRRQSPRIVLEAPALVDAFHTWRKCAVQSVSTTGISVQTDLNLPVGARADIYFEIPRAVAVEVHAEVVRRTEGVLAFRFLDLPAEVAEAIAMVVHAQRSDEQPSPAVIC